MKACICAWVCARQRDRHSQCSIHPRIQVILIFTIKLGLISLFVLSPVIGNQCSKLRPSHTSLPVTDGSDPAGCWLSSWKWQYFQSPVKFLVPGVLHFCLPAFALLPSLRMEPEKWQVLTSSLARQSKSHQWQHTCNLMYIHLSWFSNMFSTPCKLRHFEFLL